MNERLVIHLPELPTDHQIVYIGERARVSSATSTIIVDGHSLVACHFNGCRMFLVRFDMGSGKYELVDQIQTEFQGRPTETDLMSWDGHGNIVTTNFFHHNCSFYRLGDDKLAHDADSSVRIGDFVHGVKFYSPDVVAVTSRKKHGGVYFINRRTDKLEWVLRIPKLSVQDICFLSPTRAAVISGHGSPLFRAFNIYDSVIHLLDVVRDEQRVEVRGKRVFKASHLDNIIHYMGRLYITDQYNNSVVVLDPDSLETLDEYTGYDFPHGIDVNHGLLAVTNYGTNTIEVRRLGRPGDAGDRTNRPGTAA